MDFYIDKIQKFFSSIANYFDKAGNTFSWLFIIFVGLFVFATLCIIFASNFSYEMVLTRAIDKINKFLSKNPRINEDNLVTFNNKMKDKGIPKALRRQWQQFMLYREHEASYYMSFQHCVENPLKSSSYTQQMQAYRVVSLVLVTLSALLGVFCTYQTNFYAVLRDIVIIPSIIIVFYLLISMILNLVHNATKGDLYQNYQYFEININKATMTLPEYVDYEVLFTHEEIKKGIPVLFEYIQKRAVEEQKELEKARIKNIEHEKFNFDKSGLDESLVLERSMQEAESYIATRKKLQQDIEQINNEIGAIENQYRENVKENQRLMQTSKESVDGLKQQLNQATSSIEINYIKKQMKDEINRQQVAERDFDTLTDKYNKETKALQADIDRIHNEIDKAKKAVEDSMMSEFGTYSSKVYQKLEVAVKQQEQNIIDDYKDQIYKLEEKLASKDEELDNIYNQYQSQVSQLEEKNKNFDSILQEKDDLISQVQDALGDAFEIKGVRKDIKNKKDKKKKDVPNEELTLNEEAPVVSPLEETKFDLDEKNDDNKFDLDDNKFDLNDNNFDLNDNSNFDLNNDEKSNLSDSDDFNLNTNDNFDMNLSNSDDLNSDNLSFDYLFNENDNSEKAVAKEDEKQEDENQAETFNYLDSNVDDKKVASNDEDVSNKDDDTSDEEDEEFLDVDDDETFDSWLEDDEKDVVKLNKENEENEFSKVMDLDLDENEENGEDEDSDNESDSEDLVDEESNDEEQSQPKKAGRPRKVQTDNQGMERYGIMPRRAGRPKKSKTSEDTISKIYGIPERKAGRPRKEVEEPVKEFETPVKKAGRPKKVVKETIVRKVGRPKKVEKLQARNVGRPKKSVPAQETRKVGRPKKAVIKSVGRPKKPNPVGRPKKANPVGRPKSVQSSKAVRDIDAKLARLNRQIKLENERFAKTKAQINSVKLNNKRKK